MLVGALLVLNSSFSSGAVFAQTGGHWSTPAKVYESQGTMIESTLAADQTGALHAFWLYQEPDSPGMIFYARWDGTEWTQPIDVVVMSGTLSGFRGVADQQGRLHLIWHGPGNTLFYSAASAARATAAASWSTPVSLAQSNPHADIVVDDTGALHVVFPQLLEGGLSYIRSQDGGQNWTEPVKIADPVRDNATTEFARLSIANGGIIHVAWTELTLPEGYPPVGVFYSRSADAGQTWSEPIEFAGNDYMEVDILAVGDSEVYAAWNGRSGISGRYSRWSQDAGLTWSGVITLTPPEFGGGSTNPPELAADSEGTVHIVLNTSPGNMAGNDATMHVYGRHGQWTPAVDISQQAAGYVGWVNEASALTITLGNTLHVLFVDNNASRLWHTWKYSSAVATQPVAFSAPASETDTWQEDTATDTLTPTTKTANQERPVSPSSQVAAQGATARATTGPSTTMLISIIPVVLLVGAVVVTQVMRRRNRR
jgi:hypothetical protein